MSDFRAGKPLFPLRDETAATKKFSYSAASCAITEDDDDEEEEEGVGRCSVLSKEGRKATGTDTASTMSLAEDGETFPEVADKAPMAETVSLGELGGRMCREADYEQGGF